MRIRYIVAIVPSLVILSVSGIHNMMTWRVIEIKVGGMKRALHIVTIAFVVAMLGYNANYISDLYRRYTPIAFLSGALDRDSYILKHRPEYALFRYANIHLNKNSKILGLFMGNRRYYSDIPINLNEDLFLRAAQEADDPAVILSLLSAQGLTHLMVQRDIFDFWIKNNLDPSKVEIVKRFFNSALIEMIASGGYSLYKISSVP